MRTGEPCDHDEKMDYEGDDDAPHPSRSACHVNGQSQIQKRKPQENNDGPHAEDFTWNTRENVKQDDCKSEHIRKKLNDTKITPIDIESTTSEIINDDDTPNVLIPHQLLESHTLEKMVNNIRPTLPPSCHIATPFALSYANFSDVNWNQILNLCSSQTLPEDTIGTFFFPTFTGNINFGHWHLTIVDINDYGNYGYI